MKSMFVAAILFVFSQQVFAKTDLYHQTFGSPQDPAIVFLHGGPGSNSYSFEGTAAEELADEGYYVVTYDQRGSGRSPKGQPQDFTFAKATADLQELIDTLNLKQPTLLGHSWGGVLGLQFLRLHPSEAAGLIVMATPFNFPEVYRAVFANSTEFYEKVGDANKAQKVAKLEDKMFPKGVKPPYDFAPEDVGATMGFAVECGLHFLPEPNAASTSTWMDLMFGPDGYLVTDMAEDPQNYFLLNEKVPNLNYAPEFAALQSQIYGIYGEKDRLFNEVHMDEIRATLTDDHMAVLKDSAHFLFVDKKKEMLEQILLFHQALQQN